MPKDIFHTNTAGFTKLGREFHMPKPPSLTGGTSGTKMGGVNASSSPFMSQLPTPSPSSSSKSHKDAHLAQMMSPLPFGIPGMPSSPYPHLLGGAGGAGAPLAPFPGMPHGSSPFNLGSLPAPIPNLATTGIPSDSVPFLSMSSISPLSFSKSGPQHSIKRQYFGPQLKVASS